MSVVDKITFLKELAARLSEILPPGYTASPVADGVRLNTPDGLGTFGWAGEIDRDPTDLDLFASAAWTVMNSVQDGVCETSRECWPPLSPEQPRQMANPGARREGSVLIMWYGEEAAPAVRLRPIELSR